jgi:prepilin-type N-terminal cleavage/methylation domain-containing protein
MRNQLRQHSRAVRQRASSGFSLIELMIAMAVFLVVAGAAIGLFSSHANLFGDQQSTVALNISLRNALSQIQTDAVQAGNGFYGALATSSTPVGVTILNTAGAFDTLNIIQVAPGTVPIQLDTPCANINQPTAVNLAAGSGPSVGQFNAGDVVMFINGGGNQMTVATLTGVAVVNN